MAYSKTRNGGAAENGIPEHQIRNSKTRIRNTKSGSNCIECQSHANKSRLVDSSGRIILVLQTALFQQERAQESATCLSAYLLFLSMPVNIVQYRGTVGILDYRIFVKESNIKKLSLSLHNNFCNDSALVLCNDGFFYYYFFSFYYF